MRIKYPNDLVLYLQLDEGSGTQATDLSNYNNHGKIHGATWTKGIVGNALSFDRIDDYVDCGNKSIFIFSGDFSVEVWVKHTSTANQIYVSKWTGECPGSTWWLGYYAEKAAFGYYWSDGSKIIFGGNIADGKWHHVVGIRKGSKIYIYVDGELKDSADVVVEPAGDNDAPLTIGNFNGGSGWWWFGGIIDEIRVYNRALSEDEIKQLYQDGFRKLFRAGERPFLQDRGKVLHLSFNEPSGNIAYDNSGHKNDGTIYGAQRVASRFGRALKFDGVDDYVEVPDSESLHIEGEITIAHWIKFDSIPQKWMTIDKGPASGNSWYWYHDSTDPRYSNFVVYIDNTRFNHVTYYDWEIGKWYFVAFTIGSDGLKMFVNGKKIASWTDVTYVKPNGYSLLIGKYTSEGYEFDGTIDEVRIYNRALSPEEIKQLYYNYLKKRSLEGE